MTELSSLPPAQALPASTDGGSRKNRRQSGYLWALAALTVFSGFLCFHRLSVPPLLIDECFTYWRVCGTLSQLLDTLRNDAFMPLHYEIINWIGQGFPLGGRIHLMPGGITLTPTVLRFVPALCGTLMTPVMYFLARQMFNRRTALIAAAFITCSAYSLFFSRNAKMYAPAWMFETLTIACFLWWLRTWKRIAWLSWIFAGVAASGFNVITLIVLLPLPPLYFISAGRFSRWKVPVLLIGMATISLAPAVYYGVFNRWTQNSGGLVPGVVGDPVPDAKWQASGLDWIPPAPDSISLPLEALNNYLTGLQWEDLDDLANPSPLLRRFSTAMIALATATCTLLILGALPWSQHRRFSASEIRPQPHWRGLLWVTLWVVLPVYCCFYCRSVKNFSSPVDWLEWVGHLIGLWWIVVVVGAISAGMAFNYLPRAGMFIAIPLLLLVLAVAVQTGRNDLQWMVYLNFTWFRISFLILLSALLFHFSGENFRQRSHQALLLLSVVGTVWVLCEGAAVSWRTVHEVSMRKHPELPWKSLWNIRYVAVVMPAVWLAAAALISRLPSRFVQTAAVLMICCYNVADGLARQYIQTEVPLDRAMVDMFASQPHSSVRTYFALSQLTNNIFYRPLASYSACMAAGLRPSPTDFRTGNTWPFDWGNVVGEFQNQCIYNASVSSKQIHHDVAANPQVTRVIVWELSWPAYSIKPLGDPAVRGLGNGWLLASDEEIRAHSYWTWGDQWTLRRREFHRKT